MCSSRPSRGTGSSRWSSKLIAPPSAATLWCTGEHKIKLLLPSGLIFIPELYAKNPCHCKDCVIDGRDGDETHEKEIRLEPNIWPFRVRVPFYFFSFHTHNSRCGSCFCCLLGCKHVHPNTQAMAVKNAIPMGSCAPPKKTHASICGEGLVVALALWKTFILFDRFCVVWRCKLCASISVACTSTPRRAVDGSDWSSIVPTSTHALESRFIGKSTIFCPLLAVLPRASKRKEETKITCTLLHGTCLTLPSLADHPNRHFFFVFFGASMLEHFVFNVARFSVALFLLPCAGC